MLSYSYYYDYYESYSRAMTGYYIGAIIVGLISSLICGGITKSINERKGYDGGFAWGFWLGVIGIIVVACRPALDSYDDHQSYYQNSNNMPSGGWQCVCGRVHSSYETSCVCGSTKRNAPTVLPRVDDGRNSHMTIKQTPQPWVCTCGVHHSPYENSCSCGKLRSMVVTANSYASRSMGTPAATPATVMPGEHSKQDFAAAKPAVAPAEDANIQTLRKYKSLLDEGAITQEEYDAKKKELLNL